MTRKRDLIINKDVKNKIFGSSNKNIKTYSGTGFKKTFKNIVTRTKKHLNNLKPKCKKMLMELAFATAQELASGLPIKPPRVIPVPKTGGFLPLVPILAGLSAAGSLAGGVAGIRKAINGFKTAKKRIEGLKRCNKEIGACFIGEGLHLKPYKDGLGIFVSKKKN